MGEIMKTQKRSLGFFVIAVFAIMFSFAQNSFSADNLDSKGKDFWLTFIPNYHNNIDNTNTAVRFRFRIWSGNAR